MDPAYSQAKWLPFPNHTLNLKFSVPLWMSFPSLEGAPLALFKFSVKALAILSYVISFIKCDSAPHQTEYIRSIWLQIPRRQELYLDISISLKTRRFHCIQQMFYKGWVKLYEDSTSLI